MKPLFSTDPIRKTLSRASRAPGHYQRYALSLGIIVLITAGAVLVRDLIVPTNLVMPYLLGVVSIAVLWGRGPAIFASVLGVIAFDFFLVPPYLTFVVEDTEYVITFLALFTVGVFISGLTAQLKDRMVAAREGEARVTALYRLSHDLAAAYSLPDVLETIGANIRMTLGMEVKIHLLASPGDGPDGPRFDVFPRQDTGNGGPLDEAVVAAFRSGRPAGAGTQAIPESATVNLPLVTNRGTIGVLSISGPHPAENGQDEHLQSLEAFANLSALAIERVYLNREAAQAQLLIAKGELQATLLNSISHDFRTPLVTITGTLSSLDTGIDLLDRHSQQSLVRHALAESEKLNRLVSNLLNINRLESGALQLQLEPVDLQDLIGATLEAMKNRIDREIVISLPENLPLVEADFVLVQQALINLLENALKYSPAAAAVELAAAAEGERVYLTVSDHGPGIPADEIPHIFKKFYRVNSGPQPGGTGMGLAIVQGVMDAHAGVVDVCPGEEGGMIFRLGLRRFTMDREVAGAG
ncbi:MAG TPA: DUF4118 domain-containing protein [Anaerolineales bacterium]|nr:DUF4118 domain-containing protein [Anaerolineales bacterium]